MAQSIGKTGRLVTTTRVRPWTLGIVHSSHAIIVPASNCVFCAYSADLKATQPGEEAEGCQIERGRETPHFGRT